MRYRWLVYFTAGILYFIIFSEVDYAATLNLSSNNLSFTAIQGGDNPDQKILTITNSDEDVMEWVIELLEVFSV